MQCDVDIVVIIRDRATKRITTYESGSVDDRFTLESAMEVVETVKEPYQCQWEHLRYNNEIIQSEDKFLSTEERIIKNMKENKNKNN